VSIVIIITHTHGRITMSEVDGYHANSAITSYPPSIKLSPVIIDHAFEHVARPKQEPKHASSQQPSLRHL